MSTASGLAKTLVELDLCKMRGIEVGPLDNPRITKDQADVYYLDYMTAEELRAAHQSEDGVNLEVARIVEVDLVARDNASVPDTVGDLAPIDYVLAAHVIEHVPDIIGWLAEIAQTLRDGGFLSLVIPDKRFSFDVNRPLTQISELVEAHLLGLRRSPYRHIYDMESRMVLDADAIKIWSGAAEYSGEARRGVGDPDQYAYQRCLYALRSGEYFDVHNSIFTPASFLDLYRRLVTLGLVDYRIARFFPTEQWENEFFVTLAKLPVGVDPDEKLRLQLQSIPRFWAQEPVPVAGGFEVSELEMRAIHIKRRAIMGARRRVGNWRPTGS